MTNYSLRGITKNYGAVKALKGIDLEIFDELLGIIGHSGVGKTTLLKILAGLETPTHGTIKYNNMQITLDNVQLLRKKATMIFQTPLFLRGDVYTNIAYGLRLRKTSESKIKEQVNDIDKLGFFHFNTQHKWHAHLNPDNMIYIDFRDLNFKQRLHVVKNNEPDTDRPPLAEQEGLSEIVSIVRELYEKDYEYFESIPWISNITDSWL